VFPVRDQHRFAVLFKNLGLEPKFFFRRQLIRNIHQIADQAHRGAAFVPGQGKGDAGPEYFPGLLTPPHLKGAAAVFHEGVVEQVVLRLQGFGFLIRVEEEDVPPHRFFPGVAEQAFRPPVPAGDIARQIHGDDRIVDAVQDFLLLAHFAGRIGQIPLALAQGFPHVQAARQQGGQIAKAALIEVRIAPGFARHRQDAQKPVLVA